MASLQRRIVSASRRRDAALQTRVHELEDERFRLLYADDDRNDGRAMGWSGTGLSGGRFQSTDPGNNPDLGDQQWIGEDSSWQGIGEQMLTDGAVAASVNEWIERARNADWTIQPGDPDDADARMQAEFIRRNLFEISATKWGEVVRNATKSIIWGCALSEVVFGWDAKDATPTYELEERPGFLPQWSKSGGYDVGHNTLVDLPARLPISIQEWKADPETGGFGGIIQEPPQDDTGDAFGGDVYIPADRLCLFTHGGDGSNWEGVARFRAVYIPWKARQVLLRMGVITSERFGVGVPIARQTEQEYRDKAEAKRVWSDVKDMLARYRGGTQAWMALPHGYDVSILDSALPAVKSIVELYNLLGMEIHICGNTQHLVQGTQNVGSYDMREGQSADFRSTVNPLLEQVAEVVNRAVVRPLVDLNWPGVREYPYIQVGDQAQGTSKEDLEAYSTGVNAGAIHPQPEDEDYFRQGNGWPAMTEATLAQFGATGPEADADSEPQKKDDDGGETEPKQLTEHEGCCDTVTLLADGEEAGTPQVDIPPRDRIRLLAESRFDGPASRVSREDAVKRTATEAHVALARAADKYLEKIAKAIDAGDRAEIAKTAVPGREIITPVLRRNYIDVNALAKDEVKRETRRMKDAQFQESLSMALAEWERETADPVDWFAENPSGQKNTIDKTVRDAKEVRTGTTVAATTSANDFINQMDKSFNDYFQQNLPDQWDTTEAKKRALGVITPRTMSRSILGDVNTVYNTGRAQQGRAEGAGVAVYTLQPELGLNGPHEPCAECQATAESADNPAIVGTPAEDRLMAPNPECLSTLGGVNNCWCAIIYMTTTDPDAARRAAGL